MRPFPQTVILGSVLFLLCHCQQNTSLPRSSALLPQINYRSVSPTDYESIALVLTNSARARQGKAPLRHNPRLAEAARRHSQVMAKHGYVQHHEPSGVTLRERIDRAGVKPRAWAENVFGPDLRATAVDHDLLTPHEAVSSWIESPGHRRNLLSSDYTEVGLGYSNGYWTQIFVGP